MGTARRIPRVKTLAPVADPREVFDQIEKEIVRIFHRELYQPLIREFGTKAVLNDSDALRAALRSGRVTFNRGVFSGKFSAKISGELRALGARWSRVDSAFHITLDELPLDVQNAISASAYQFERKIERINRKLDEVVPEEFAGQFRTERFFDSALWKTEKGLEASGVVLPAKLTAEQRKKIAAEWQNNMNLWITDFTAKQIKELRGDLQKSILAGNRFESAIQTIRKSYGVTQRKAKFLASQETRLLVCKFKETRYLDAGIRYYKWKCVSGTPAHPVRPRHRELNDESLRGKTFRFDQPPVTSAPSEPSRRNNPGEDYNCRCTAIPVVSFAD